MSKFAQIEGHDIVVENTLMELNYVEEGWGEAIGALATFAVGAGAGLIGGLKAGQKIGGDGILGSTLGGLLSGFLGFVGGFAGYVLFNAATAKKFMKIINHPKVHEYLEKEADAILKEAKKEDKTLLTDYEFKDDDLEKAAEEGKLDVKGVMAAWRYMKSAEIKVGKYNVLLMGDREELKRIVLVLYSQKFNRLVLKDLPVPSREELKAMTAEAAKESMEVAEEGWKAALSKVFGSWCSFALPAGILMLLTGSAIPGVIGGAFAGIAGMKAINVAASKELSALLKKSELQNYIKEESAKAFKELRKEHKKLTADVSSALRKLENKKAMNADERGPVSKFLTKFAKCTVKIGEYTIVATGDGEEFDGLFVIFYDEEAEKIIKHALPVPAVDDLK